MSNMEFYINTALLWAEKYGIVKYKVQGSKMVYNVSYPATAYEKARTYKHIVDLDTGREEVIQLQRVDKEGYYNRR